MGWVLELGTPEPGRFTQHRELWLRGTHLRGEMMERQGLCLQTFVPGGQLGGPQAEKS